VDSENGQHGLPKTIKKKLNKTFSGSTPLLPDYSSTKMVGETLLGHRGLLNRLLETAFQLKPFTSILNII